MLQELKQYQRKWPIHLRDVDLSLCHTRRELLEAKFGKDEIIQTPKPKQNDKDLGAVTLGAPIVHPETHPQITFGMDYVRGLKKKSYYKKKKG